MGHELCSSSHVERQSAPMMSGCDVGVSLDYVRGYSELGYRIGVWSFLRYISELPGKMKMGAWTHEHVRRQGNSTARSDESDGGEPEKKGSWQMWHSWEFSGRLWGWRVGWAERNV